MKIYSISYVAYDASDNYLHSENKVTADEEMANKLYNEWKANASADAKFDEEDPFDVFEEERCLSEHTKQFITKRHVGYEDEYQATISLTVTEV